MPRKNGRSCIAACTIIRGGEDFRQRATLVKGWPSAKKTVGMCRGGSMRRCNIVAI